MSKPPSKSPSKRSSKSPVVSMNTPGTEEHAYLNGLPHPPAKAKSASPKRILYKPTTEHNNLVYLTSDVNYHVMRYVRGRTITSAVLPGQPLHKTRVADVLSTAIKQTRQLLSLLQDEVRQLP